MRHKHLSGDEAIDLHSLALPDPVAASLSLQVILGVPVGIEDDAGVSSSQVDAQPACPCAQEKDKAIRVGLAEAVDGSLAQVAAHPSVDALIGVPAQEGKRSEQHHSGA